MYLQFWKSKKHLTDGEHIWKHGNRKGKLIYSSSIMVDGVIKEGYTLNGNANSDLPDMKVSFVLTHDKTNDYGRGINIARADWKPTGVHNNRLFGISYYRLKNQHKSHFHNYADNSELDEDIWIGQKLPIAYPIDPEPASYEEFLEFVGKSFKICDINKIARPPWNYEIQSEMFPL